jgi:hypothetical protein
MSLWPLVVFHSCAGTVALLSGAVAMSFRKGSRRHGLAGNVFVISMMGLAASGATVGFIKFNEFPSATGQFFCRDSNVLSGSDGMVVRQTRRWGNGHF